MNITDDKSVISDTNAVINAPSDKDKFAAAFFKNNEDTGSNPSKENDNDLITVVDDKQSAEPTAPPLVTQQGKSVSKDDVGDVCDMAQDLPSSTVISTPNMDNQRFPDQPNHQGVPDSDSANESKEFPESDQSEVGKESQRFSEVIHDREDFNSPGRNSPTERAPNPKLSTVVVRDEPGLESTNQSSGLLSADQSEASVQSPVTELVESDIFPEDRTLCVQDKVETETLTNNLRVDDMKNAVKDGENKAEVIPNENPVATGNNETDVDTHLNDNLSSSKVLNDAEAGVESVQSKDIQKPLNETHSHPVKKKPEISPKPVPAPRTFFLRPRAETLSGSG